MKARILFNNELDVTGDIIPTGVTYMHEKFAYKALSKGGGNIKQLLKKLVVASTVQDPADLEKNDIDFQMSLRWKREIKPYLSGTL